MKKRKVFIAESDWQNFVMKMAEAKIGWENQAFFQFDGRTAVVLILGAAIGAILFSVI